jgi:hypothetical protein
MKSIILVALAAAVLSPLKAEEKPLTPLAVCRGFRDTWLKTLSVDVSKLPVAELELRAEEMDECSLHTEKHSMEEAKRIARTRDFRASAMLLGEYLNYAMLTSEYWRECYKRTKKQ